MPMPVLDPARYVAVVLADPSHTLPMPDRGGRLFNRDLGETVDRFDAFYSALLADGSIVLKPKEEVAEEPVEEPAKEPVVPAAKPAAPVAVAAPVALPATPAVPAAKS